MNLRLSLKKIFTLLTIVLLAVLVIGCGDKDDDGDNAEAQIAKVYLQTLEPYLNDIPLPKYVQGNRKAVLSWTSSNPEVLEIKEYADEHANKELYFLGKVTMPESQVVVDLTATVNYNGEKAKHTFKIKVGNAYEEMTIKEAKEADKGSFVKVSGTIFFSADSGYAIADDTGFMYVYTNSKHERKVGEKVVVYAKTDIYNFMPQLASPAAKVVGNEPEDFDPTTLAEAMKIKDIVAKDKGDKELFTTYYTIKGTVKKTTNANSPYNIVNPNDPTEYIGVSKYSSAKALELLATLVDKDIEASVIVYDNRENKFSVLFPETYEEYDFAYTDQQKVDNTLADVKVEFEDLIVTGNITLPTTSAKYGTTISWASGNPEILTDAGVLVNSEVDQEVIYTVTVTIGDKTATGEVKVLVKKLEVSKIKDILPKTPSKAADPKVLVLIEGKIIAHQYHGWWVADETGAILIFTNGKDAAAKDPNLAIGTMVSVKGQLTTYGENNSFTSQISPLEVKKIEKAAPTTIAPVEVTFEQIAALNVKDYATARAAGMEWYGKYITITGKVLNKGNANFWWIVGENENHMFRLNNLISSTALTDLKDQTITITLLVREIYFVNNEKYGDYKIGNFGGIFYGDSAIVVNNE